MGWYVTKCKLIAFIRIFLLTNTALNGRNPHNGDHLTIAARKVVTFKSSPLLRKKLNAE
ncbi:MAG: HU family DNA-binding protein [Smithellaceae bacterium]